jgi:demethoxyubiquinone hydroxylase (CLK1/Coq7/Cat5 family)
MTAKTDRKDIERLKHLLQDEMSAVETYQKAIESIKHDAVRDELNELKSNHETRKQKLAAKITELGGTLPENSGLWGKFAKMLETGAAAMGDKVAIATLEECEVKSLADYKSSLEVFDEAEHKMVFSELLPAQQESYERILKLHKSLH